MAAGEYVSISFQSDVEKAALEREALELRDDPVAEHQELAQIMSAGASAWNLPGRWRQLMSSNALAAHARDELGLSDVTASRPIQAAVASALSFAIGAALPLLMVVIAPDDVLVPAVFISSLAFLALLGALGARTGGANPTKGAARVAFWGAGAMASTAGIGAIFGSSTY